TIATGAVSTRPRCAVCRRLAGALKATAPLDIFVFRVCPREVVFRAGAAHLRCHRLSATGLYRWTAGFCNAPIGNTRPRHPWFGVFHLAYRAADPDGPAEHL
ncbi:MAG: hypothetical protein VYA68_10325, partial [Pseudomonadota bacterium]|nr:hypothetical protein [Pseudomonadota bacterium]